MKRGQTGSCSPYAYEHTEYLTTECPRPGSPDLCRLAAALRSKLAWASLGISLRIKQKKRRGERQHEKESKMPRMPTPKRKTCRRDKQRTRTKMGANRVTFLILYRGPAKNGDVSKLKGWEIRRLRSTSTHMRRDTPKPKSSEMHQCLRSYGVCMVYFLFLFAAWFSALVYRFLVLTPYFCSCISPSALIPISLRPFVGFCRLSRCRFALFLVFSISCLPPVIVLLSLVLSLHCGTAIASQT